MDELSVSVANTGFFSFFHPLGGLILSRVVALADTLP